MKSRLIPLLFPVLASASLLGPEFSVTPAAMESQPQEGSDQALIDTTKDAPVVLEDMSETPSVFGKRPWQPPDYANQKDVPGYSPEIFKIPLGLEKQVKFWIDIFSKYSSEQGVLHDSRYIDIVYQELDFAGLNGGLAQGSMALQRAKKQAIKEARKQIEDRLMRLSAVQDPSKLEGEDLRVWNLFADVKEPNRFKAAAERGRLRFQLGLKDRFVQGIYYSGRYLSEMEKIFAEAGLPRELTRLPFVESSFNIQARSKVGASGIWQFMQRTGRMYMKVNSSVDERNEPLLATRAATRLLKFNYSLLQSWPLAVTAYNFGPSGMKREKEKWQTDDLVEISQKSTNRRFGFASSNFYASFLAALEVERDAKRYLGPVVWSKPIEAEEFVTTKSISTADLIAVFKGDRERAFIFNPHLSKSVQAGRSPIPLQSRLRIPLGAGLSLASGLSDGHDGGRKPSQAVQDSPHPTVGR